MREARRNRNLTIAAVAEQINRDENTVWRWENGYMRVTATDLYRVAQIYGVSVDWLLSGEEAPSIPDADLHSLIFQEWAGFTQAERAFLKAAVTAVREARAQRERNVAAGVGDDDQLNDLLDLYARASVPIRESAIESLREAIKVSQGQAQ